MTRTPLEILDCAIELLRDPSHWTKGSFARNAEGENVGVRHPEAVTWCMLGAIDHCTPMSQHTGQLVERQVGKVLGDKWNGDVVRFNDDPRRSHGGVIRVLKRARNQMVAEAAVAVEE